VDALANCLGPDDPALPDVPDPAGGPLMATLTKSELKRRRRLINVGEWNDAWIVLSDGREFFAGRVVTLADPDTARLTARDGSELAVVRLADVVKVVH
jgi:hypothetical protein